MDDNSTLRKNPNATYRTLAAGGGGVLLHLETGEYHGLNEIGCRIWELIDGERTTEDITEAIRAEVDDPPARLADDVTGFIDAMRERDLILAST